MQPTQHFLSYFTFKKTTKPQTNTNQTNKEKANQHKQIQVKQRDETRSHSKNFFSAHRATPKCPLVRAFPRHLPQMLTRRQQQQKGILCVLFAPVHAAAQLGNKGKRHRPADGKHLFWRHVSEHLKEETFACEVLPWKRERLPPA